VSTADDPVRPPDAYIAGATDAGSVKGGLGSFTYCDTAADALPPRAANVPPLALDDLSVKLSVPSGEPLIGYRAGYWPATEWQGDETRYADATVEVPVSTTEFDAPPSGDWMLAIHVTFPVGGTAVYYWHVTVP